MAADKELLDYLEKTFADAYRKEIDQEENIWRSLPFFAATLALQLAVISAIGVRIGELPNFWFWMASLGLALVALGSVGAVVWVAAAIYPARFKYVATEPGLLLYAANMVEVAEMLDTKPLMALKVELVRQYAAATDNNRNINQKRAWRRTVAGLFTLLSVLATVGVVAIFLLSKLTASAAGGYHV